MEGEYVYVYHTCKSFLVIRKKMRLFRPRARLTAFLPQVLAHRSKQRHRHKSCHRRCLSSSRPRFNAKAVQVNPLQITHSIRSSYAAPVLSCRTTPTSHLHDTKNIEPIPIIIHRLTTKFFAHCPSHPNLFVQQSGIKLWPT
jgi:hypothetical protein